MTITDRIDYSTGLMRASTIVARGIACCFMVILALLTLPDSRAADLRQAVFAGGCFWCMEPPFDALEGVVETTSGYTGGHVPNPTYKAVSKGATGHTEAIRITYDPDKVSYARLLDVFWRNIDPLDAGGQFCDRGSQYRSEIFVANEAEKQIAENSKRHLESGEVLNQSVATAITAATVFYPAEDYHQDYYQKNPARFKFYKWNCGRQQRLDRIWKDIPESATR